MEGSEKQEMNKNLESNFWSSKNDKLASLPISITFCFILSFHLLFYSFVFLIVHCIYLMVPLLVMSLSGPVINHSWSLILQQLCMFGPSSVLYILTPVFTHNWPISFTHSGWLIDWKFYLILVAHLVKYYFRWPRHLYTIYTHSYYYIYNIYTYYLQTELLKLLKIDIIVFKIESLIKDT